MKREVILAIPAGRELDALAAEKVMGWEVCSLVAKGVCWVYKNNELNIHDGECFNPSTVLSATWEVVEKMRSKNWWIVLNSEGETWNALFYWDPHQQACEAEAKTAPEAICKAALLAVLEESP